MYRFASRVVLAVLLSAAIGAPAFAQSKKRQRPTPTKSSKRAKTTKGKAKEAPSKTPKSFEFEADNIDGDRINPDGTTIFGIPAAKQPSLIRVRSDFISEILKSAENL